MNSLIKLSPFFYIIAVFVILIFKNSSFYLKFIDIISNKFKNTKYIIYFILMLFFIFFWLKVPYAFQASIVLFVIVIYFENKDGKDNQTNHNKKIIN